MPHLSSFGCVVYIHQVSLQSLEAIVLIGAKSVGRISELCMHVGMQILGAAVCYTLPSTHRRFPPRPTCSLLCSEALGAMITQMAPPIPHSKTLDKISVPNSFNCSLAAFFTSSENLRCPHFVATCGPAPKPNCHGCGPKTPRRSCSTRSCRLSHSFWRLSKMLRQIFNNLQASLQDTYNNRQPMIPQAGGKRTVMHTHTRQHQAVHTETKLSQSV